MEPPTSQAAMTMSSLPAHTYAMMVHKIYAQRVQDFLYQQPVQWRNMQGEVMPTVTSSSSSYTSNIPTNGARTLDTPMLRGPHATRRGFVLLYLPCLPAAEAGTRPLFALPPMARQQIAWAALLTHTSSATTSTNLEDVSRHIWETLGWDCLDNIRLRVDVYPPDQTAPVCQALQRQAAAAAVGGCVDHTTTNRGVRVSDERFEGAIALTKSASHCTHRWTILCLEQETFWGCRTEALPAFNSDAGQQIVWSRTDEQTGQDIVPNVPIATPVSRAYYKLHQVWEQQLSHYPPLVAQFPGTTALDVGACPGGWTQVLIHVMGFDHVVMIDPGRPAHRVRDLPPLTHLASRGALAELPSDLITKVSLLVCDVSVIWLECFHENLETLIPKVADRWTLPAAWVVTCKLPHKQVGSVARHVRKMHHDTVPTLLQTCLPQMYPPSSSGGGGSGVSRSGVRARYSILHLFANSDSERTLLVLFEKDDGAESSH